jgi:hypothetical protein
VADLAPVPNSKQYYVSALGGTQTGVTVSSIDKPFTLTLFKPVSFQRLPPVNPVTGVLPRTARNVWRLLTRKGATPLSGQTPQLVTIETIISVPAGCETADFPAIAAAMSAHIGSLWEQSNELGDSLASGAL